MPNIQTIKELSIAYRKFLLELGAEFEKVKENKEYEGFADTWIDFVKSPEIGFSQGEVASLIKMSHMFGPLEPNDLPSHHNMKFMVNKKIDMDLLEDAQTLTHTDFKERHRDVIDGTQERTYTYEIIKRCNETGNIKRVYDEEIEEAKKQLWNTN